MRRPTLPHTFVGYFGHHKCGSAWCGSIMQRIARKMRLRHARLSRKTDFDSDLRGFVERKHLNCVSWSNAEYIMLEGLDCRGFHVVRDPRDLLVSAYFSHLKTHGTEQWPRLAEFRPKLQQASKDDGLMMEFDFIRDVFRRLGDWQHDDPRFLTFRLEDLADDPRQHFRRAFEFLGLFDAGLKERTFEKVLDTFSFENLSGGRTRGQEDTGSHYRKGVHGDWQNHLTNQHIDRFKQHHNALLIKFGYETTDNW